MTKRDCSLNQTCKQCRWYDYCKDDIRTRDNNALKNNCYWFYCKYFDTECQIDNFKCKHKEWP